jgi:hypothetical protein
VGLVGIVICLVFQDKIWQLFQDPRENEETIGGALAGPVCSG